MPDPSHPPEKSDEAAAQRAVLQSLITAVLYLILFVVLLPPLLRILDTAHGKTLYGALLAGAVGVALRLRHLSRKL